MFSGCRYRPAPFVMLDELDASLDVVNVCKVKTFSSLFSNEKLLSLQNQREICNNIVTADPATPEMCRYTTL